MILCMGCMEEYDEKYDRCPYCDYVKNTPAKEAYHMTPGTILQGKYIVGKVIGYGGFGVTYIGQDALLQKKIAIKEYLPGEFSTRIPGQTELTIFSGEKSEQFEQGVKKFVDEAKRLAMFQKEENIVRIQDTFNENNTAYIIMEYLEGETLKKYLERVNRVDVDVAVEWIIPLAEALEKVHREGIIHRDISPDNIFLTKDGKVKLLDFGAARSATVGHSKSLSVIVKPGYAPTEQYRSRGEQGSWTDVYALAATFYTLITGIIPEDSMERMGNDTLKLPSKLGVKISKGMEAAIMNALQIDFQNRTQNMTQFLKELRTENTKLKQVKEKKKDVGKWTLPMKLGVGLACVALVVTASLMALGIFGSNGVRSGNQRLGYEIVPDLTGVEYAEAESMVKEIGIELRQAAYSFSDDMPENVILAQSIPEGSDASESQTMEVIVSLGKERRVIGDIVGFQMEKVTDKLEGFNFNTVEVESEIASGAIVSVCNSAGEEIDLESEYGIGNTIQINVSIGKSSIGSGQASVPELANMTFSDARKLIDDADLYIQKVEEEISETVPKGSIISQDVESGTSVNKGTVISVVISKGKAPQVAIPNILDKDEQEAIEALQKAGLEINVIYEESSLVEEGKVIRTSPQVNEMVDEGSVVDVVISKGSGSTRTTRATTREQNNTQQTTERVTSPPPTNPTPATQAPSKPTEAPTTERKTTQEKTTQESTTEAPTTQQEDDEIIIIG